jgi:hypothetical protein
MKKQTKIIELASPPSNQDPQTVVQTILAKLRRALRIEIPIGYQDESGFHRIVARSPIRQ